MESPYNYSPPLTARPRSPQARPARRLAALGVALAALVLPTSAHARDLDEPGPVEWRWDKFRPVEYPLTIGAMGAAMYFRFKVDPPGTDARGGILFDEWIQDRAGIHNLKLRSQVAVMTDALFYGSMAYRFFDSTVFPWAYHKQGEVALQMTRIDLESFGTVAFSLWTLHLFFGRERPFARRCGDPAFAREEGGCPLDSAEHNRSLFAGHPAVVMAAAGLTCTHHRHMKLYGGGAADTLACGLLIGAAGLTGVGRVITEKHYASDLVVGLGVGAFAGFVMPELLHYRHARPRQPATAERPPLVQASVAPLITPGNLGLGLQGVF
jgi:membrane-associated phospholipid phosphatase